MVKRSDTGDKARGGGTGPDKLDSTVQGRRQFLRNSVMLAGATAAAGAGGVRLASADPLKVQESRQSLGRPIEEKAYGMPSKYEAHVTRNRTDVFVNKQNWSDWSMTPLAAPEGHRHAERPVLRTPPRRHTRHRPRPAQRLSCTAWSSSRCKFSMNDLMRYRVGVEVPLHGMLGQRV